MFIWRLMKYLHKTFALIFFSFFILSSYCTPFALILPFIGKNICSAPLCAFKREFSSPYFFPFSWWKSDAYCAGVARGCGWQHLAVYANLGTFYCIGMPIAILLGFKLKLYAKVLISILRAHTLLNRYYFLLVVLLTGFLLSVLCFLTGLVVGSNLRPLLPGRHPFVAHTALKMDSYGAIWKHQ